MLLAIEGISAIRAGAPLFPHLALLHGEWPRENILGSMVFGLLLGTTRTPSVEAVYPGQMRYVCYVLHDVAWCDRYPYKDLGSEGLRKASVNVTEEPTDLRYVKWPKPLSSEI